MKYGEKHRMNIMRKWLWPPAPGPFYGNGDSLQSPFTRISFVGGIMIVGGIMMSPDDYAYVEDELRKYGRVI